MTLLEIIANIVLALAVLLAGRNHVSTWPLGIIGCSLFAGLFFHTQLYAQVTLQIFFIFTSSLGWWLWLKTPTGGERPITRTHAWGLTVIVAGALMTAALYAAVLHFHTNGYEPVWDSLILVTSIIAQILLMCRKLETWIFWIVVNSIAVPLFYSRGLEITALLYAAYWVHAVYAQVKWRQYYKDQSL